MNSRVTKKNDISINLKVALTEANKCVSLHNNFVSSPLGIEIMLSILANGSTGETRNQIYKFLGTKTLKSINQKALEVMEIVSLNIHVNSEEPEVSFVNGAWVDQQNCSLKPTFQKLLAGTYKADAKAVDFRNKDKVCKEINSWASEATHGNINEVLSPAMLIQASMLILGNALFFKAAWKVPFTNCVYKPFRLLTGETVKAPMMTINYLHYAGFTGAVFDEFKLLRLPYKTGQDTREFAMYIFLPNAQDGLVGLMERFSKACSFLDQKLELPEAFLSDLWVPKFKFSHSFSVKETLMQLGLERLFVGVGELNKVVNKPFSELLYVSEMCQKSLVEVNEEGTLAASSMLGLVGGGGPPPNTFSFVADHPFMFMIREETSGVTLFVGTVLNPVSD